MITDAQIATLLAEAEPAERFHLQLLVDRIRHAEGGGVRKMLEGVCKLDPWTFFGIESRSLTRDEITGVAAYFAKDAYPLTMTDPRAGLRGSE